MKKKMLPLLALLFISCTAIIAEGAEGEWIETGPMNVDRAYHTATLLNNGKVLVAGGMRGYTYIGTDSCELYDPSTGSWSPTGSLHERRFTHTATLLNDGKVLVTGGVRESGSEGGVASLCELYDPTTGLWSLTDSLNVPRYRHTATLLPNGKVLVAGGDRGGGRVLESELYDPTTGVWTFTGALNLGRTRVASALLPNGMVLIAGGEIYPGLPTETAICELYDPLTETWRYTASMNEARVGATGTLLQDGKFLVTGGGGVGVPRPTLASCELYDPITETWTVTGSLNFPRCRHTASLLSSGELLVVGEANGKCELYNPRTGVWTYIGNAIYSRGAHTATVLTNGNVLLAGGIIGQASTWCELFVPAIPEVTATIDIDPDTLNLKSNGQWITAYITLPEEYKVEDIVLETVEVEEISAAWGEIQDGVYMAKFDRATVRETLTGMIDYEEGVKFYDLTFTVTGQLLDGTQFEGTDTITVIQK